MIKFTYKTVTQLSLYCSSLLLLSLVQATTSSQDLSLLKQVREYWKEGDYSLAKKQIQSYLNKHSDAELSEELHVLLGDLYFQEEDFAAALEEYKYIQKPNLQEKVLYNKALCLYETKQAEDLYEIAISLSLYNEMKPEEKNSITYMAASALFTMQAAQENSFRQNLLTKARDLFEICKETNFAKSALPFLTEIYLLQKENDKAADCCLSLAEENPLNKADLTTKAALLLADKNPTKAIELLHSILSLDFPGKATATYNCLLLEYQLKQFKDFINTHAEYHPFLSQDNKEVITYLLGKSLYYTCEYKQAISPLYNTLKASNTSNTAKQTAYLMLLECAYKTQDLAFYKKIWKDTPPPTDSQENSKAHLAYLDLLKLHEQKEDLIEESHTFLQKYPESSQAEKVQINLIYAVYESQKWQEAEDLVLSFLGKYESHQATPNLLRLQINCINKKLQESSLDNLSTLEMDWIKVVQKALKTPGVFTLEEKKLYQLDLIKNLFKKEFFTETLLAIEEFLTEFSSENSSYDLQLTKALCYLKNPGAKELFALHTENILQNYPQIKEEISLRMHLFNVYLQLSETAAPLETKNDLLDRAANHLYHIFQNKESSIRKENMQWLTDYYYKQADKSPVALERATILLETLLSDKVSSQELDEVNVYKLCKLFSYNAEYEKKALLLTRFVHSSNGALQSQTTLQKELLFELAKTSAELGQTGKALDLYDTLIRSCNSSIIGSTSMLERSKLLLSSMKEGEKTEENPIYLEILSNLKDIETRKHPDSEPIHLEAGLEYVYAKASLAENKECKNKKTVELLHLFEDNFLSAAEYSKENLQDKWEMINAYLQFVKIEILRYEADSTENHKATNEKLEELERNSNIPESLKKRIQVSLQEFSLNE